MSKTKPQAKAASRLPLGTTAPRSVFDMGTPSAMDPPKPKADKAARPTGYKGPIDPDKITIHSGIPMPAARAERTSANYKLLQRMQAGQVVFLPRTNANSLLAMGKKLSIRLARRDMRDDATAVQEAGPDAVGVWRLE